MQEGLEVLKHELAAAKAEIEILKLRLDNVMLLLRQEMLAHGTLPKPELLRVEES